jgi:hypothetical protein
MPPQGVLITQLPGRTDYADRSTYTVVTNAESWAGICDATHTRCLTVACFSPICKEIVLDSAGSVEGYVSPVGYFALTPGLDLYFSMYIFPYRYDAVIGGKTIRQWIADLRQ